MIGTVIVAAVVLATLAAGGLGMLARTAAVNAWAAGYAEKRLARILARKLGVGSTPAVTFDQPSYFVRQLRTGRLGRVEINVGRCAGPGFAVDGVVVVASGVSLRPVAVVRGKASSLRLHNLDIRFTGGSAPGLAGGLTADGGGTVTMTDVSLSVGGVGVDVAARTLTGVATSCTFATMAVGRVDLTVIDITGLGSATTRAGRAELGISSAQVGKAFVGTATATVADVTVPGPTRSPGPRTLGPTQPILPGPPNYSYPTLGELVARLSTCDIDGLGVTLETTMSDVVLEPVPRDEPSGSGPSASTVTVQLRCDYDALNGFLKKQGNSIAVGPSQRGSPFLRVKLASALLDGVDARVSASGNAVTVTPSAPSDGFWMFVPGWVLQGQVSARTLRRVVQNLPSGLRLSSAETDHRGIDIRAHGSTVRLLSTAPPRLEPD